MIATRLKPVPIASALLVLAGSLAGCGGTSSDKGFQSLAPQEMKVAADAGAGAAPADSSSPRPSRRRTRPSARSRPRTPARTADRKARPRPSSRSPTSTPRPERPAAPPTRSARRTCSKFRCSRCPSSPAACRWPIPAPSTCRWSARSRRPARTAQRARARPRQEARRQVPAVAAGHRLRQGIQQPARDDRRRRQEARRLSDHAARPRCCSSSPWPRGSTEPPIPTASSSSGTVDGKRSAAKFDLDQIRDGQAEDPAIEEGDVIVVNESAIKAAFQNVLKALPVTSAFVPLL